jgi:ATP:ADP antiporter, AAA family
VVSVFWCFMADLFKSEQAKRLFGFIGVGGTLGGIVGAGVTATLVERIGTVNMLLVSFTLLEVATLIVIRFPRQPVVQGPERLGAAGPEHQETIGGGIWAGITNFIKAPYLRGIGAFLILYTMSSTFLYFQQADIIGHYLSQPAARTRLLAEMEFASQSITVVTQIFLTGRVIKTIGLAATLALMPVLSIFGFAALGLKGLGLVPVLVVFVAFSVLRRGTNFALTNPAMEVLYTVVPREDKYKAKSFIETFVYRAGDQIAAWSYAGLATLGLSTAVLAWPGALLGGVFMTVGVWLGRRHSELAAEGPTRGSAA